MTLTPGMCCRDGEDPSVASAPRATPQDSREAARVEVATVEHILRQVAQMYARALDLEEETRGGHPAHDDQVDDAGLTDSRDLDRINDRSAADDERGLVMDDSPGASGSECPAQGSDGMFAEVSKSVRPSTTLRLSVALSEVLYECRGALDYADIDSPARRLAGRIVEALDGIAVGGPDRT